MNKTTTKMMKSLRFCTLLLLSLSLTSACNNERKGVFKENLLVAHLDNASTTTLKYSDLFEKVEIIIPEDGKTLLYGINKMFVHKNLFIVFDGRAQAVYVCDKDGRFVRRIGRMGNAPGEYSSCYDFTVNTTTDEVYCLDINRNRIYKYDLWTGNYKSDINIVGSRSIDHIAYCDGYLYGAQSHFISSSANDTYYMLCQIDDTTGHILAKHIDAHSYNKGWEDELIHGNIFYTCLDGETLYVMGLMDSIMSLKDGRVTAKMAVQSKNFVSKDDFTAEEKASISDISNYSRKTMAFISRLAEKKKVYNVSKLFLHGDDFYFSYTQRGQYWAKYDASDKETVVYNRFVDDVLFKNDLPNYALPKFLYADEGGVYYLFESNAISQLQRWMKDDYLSDKVSGLDKIKELVAEDSNPLLLYYRFK